MSPPKKRIPALSKSRFTAGLQCPKLLYLDCYHRDLADQVSAQQQAVFDSGSNVGKLAQQLYPGGKLIQADHFHFDEALRLTTAALRNHAVPAVYEGAFIFDDVRVRCDILARADGDTFDLIEVKGSTGVKEEHIPDAAIQYYVLNGAGIHISSVCVAHLNKEYVYPGGDYDLKQLFAVEDVTDRVNQYLPQIPTLLQAMREVLGQDDIPAIEPGRRCGNPYVCAYTGHCHKDLPEHDIMQLPRATERLLDALRAEGINDIRLIPPEFPGLNAVQQLVRECVVEDKEHRDPGIEKELNALHYPIHFLDFETFSPALPIFTGMRPYEVIPFQWSDHVLYKSGQLRHEQYLHDGTDDPRRPLAEAMLEALGKKGSIVVYSSFEQSRIRELAAAFPDLAASLNALEGRLVDLLQMVRKYCYHPEFHGSFSIKHVLPALVPGLDYKDLEIQEGGAASIAYFEIISPQTTQERRAILRRSLLNYCGRDTEAEVALYRALKGA